MLDEPDENSDDTFLTELQEYLEHAGGTAPEADQRILTELGQDISYDRCVEFTLDRLRPILLYQSHHDEFQFFKGYAPPTSTTGRARDATVFLFISAYAWFSRAMAAAESHSQELAPEFAKVAELFSEADLFVEAYVENKLPEDMGWADVGVGILESSGECWSAMIKAMERKVQATVPPDTTDSDDSKRST